MYATRRGALDSSAVFVTDANTEIEGETSDIEESKFTNETGKRFCLNRKGHEITK